MDGPHHKLRKLNGHQSHKVTFEYADHIHNALVFRQKADSEVKDAVNQFKDFLSGISRSDNINNQSKQLQTLRQYCEQQAANSKDHIDFPDLLSTWAHAVENNNEAVQSAVPAALAQFFRTISGFLEFREFGLSLCYSLLKKDQIRLFDRGLSSPKSKPHLISPCLRLLTEITTFDGGVMAYNVWQRRDILLKRLDVLLEPQSSRMGLTERRQPSVRRMALRFVLAMFKFLDADAKTELIAQGKAMRTCLHGLVYDGDDIILELLRAIDMSIVEDLQISKQAKIRFFGAQNLSALAALYNVELELDNEADDPRGKIRETTHNLLFKLCSTRKGVTLTSTGWYPMGFRFEAETIRHHNYIDLGLDSPSFFDSYTTSVPIRNTVLSAFLQTLKPGSDVMQSKLAKEILQSAPELVAEYLAKNPKFTASPVNESDWRLQFAFLFSIVQLPIPHNLGWPKTIPTSPPPLSIVIESILPRPFDRVTTTKLFGMDDEVMVISAARLLSVALDKLSAVLKQFATFDANQHLWQEASTRLIGFFIDRAPQLKDVIIALQHMKTEAVIVTSATLECLTKYYESLPEVVVGSKFDIGPAMVGIVEKLESDEEGQEQRTSLEEMFMNCLTIAQLSPVTKWTHKPDLDTLSPVGRILHLLSKRILPPAQSVAVSTIIGSVLEEKGAIHGREQSLAALLESLKPTKKFTPSEEVFLFLDNCIKRSIQYPVRYLDRTEAVQKIVSDIKPLSLLVCSVEEQWGYAVKKHVENNKDELKAIATWIARLFGALDSVGENFRVMSHLKAEMLQACAEKGKAQTTVQKAFAKVEQKPIVVSATTFSSSRPQHQSESLATPAKGEIKPRPVDLTQFFKNFTTTPSIPQSLDGLDKWDANTDIDLSVQTSSSRLARLLLCASSTEEEVRRQMLTTLSKVSYIVQNSNYEEKTQLYLLLGEYCETIKQHGLTGPLPTLASILAGRVLEIITDPSHGMYGKVNKFLLRSPSWRIDSLVPYWVEKVLLMPPETEVESDAWTKEVEWLLQWLVDTLAAAKAGREQREERGANNADTTTPTNDDLAIEIDIFRRTGVYERVLALYSMPHLARSIRLLILNLLYVTISPAVGAEADDEEKIASKPNANRRGESAATAAAAAAANMLWTRVGVSSWMQMMIVQDNENQHVLTALLNLLKEQSDQTRTIQEWKERRPVLKRKEV